MSGDAEKATGCTENNALGPKNGCYLMARFFFFLLLFQ
jgi:hypothetical protein